MGLSTVILDHKIVTDEAGGGLIVIATFDAPPSKEDIFGHATNREGVIFKTLREHRYINGKGQPKMPFNLHYKSLGDENQSPYKVRYHFFPFHQSEHNLELDISEYPPLEPFQFNPKVIPRVGFNWGYQNMQN